LNILFLKYLLRNKK